MKQGTAGRLISGVAISVGPRRGGGPTHFMLRRFLSARARALGRPTYSFGNSCRPALERWADLFRDSAILVGLRHSAGPTHFQLRHSCRPTPARRADLFRGWRFLSARDGAAGRLISVFGDFCRPVPERWADPFALLAISVGPRQSCGPTHLLI